MWAGSTPTSVGASHSRGSSMQWHQHQQEFCTVPGKFHRTGHCWELQTVLGISGGCFPDKLATHTPCEGLIGHQSRLCLCHSHAHRHISPSCALAQTWGQLCAPQSPSNCFPKPDAVKLSIANAVSCYPFEKWLQALYLCKQVIDEVQMIQLNMLHTQEYLLGQNELTNLAEPVRYFLMLLLVPYTHPVQSTC